MNNIELFEYSKVNADDLNDIVNPHGSVVISEDIDKPTTLMNYHL